MSRSHLLLDTQTLNQWWSYLSDESNPHELSVTSRRAVIRLRLHYAPEDVTRRGWWYVGDHLHRTKNVIPR